MADQSRFMSSTTDDPLMIGSSRFSTKFGNSTTTPEHNTSLLLGSGAKKAAMPLPTSTATFGAVKNSTALVGKYKES